MKKIITLTLAALAATLMPMPTAAQRVMTLPECIDYAVSHNISVEQYRLAIKQREVALNSARSSRLPLVDASASHTYNFGRSLSSDNTYISQNTQNTSLGVSASLPVFTGFKIPRERDVARLNLAAATADLQTACDNIAINVAQAYLQVLYQQELVQVSVGQLALSNEQSRRVDSLVAIGKSAAYDAAQARSEVEQNRSTHVQNQNAYNLALLDLSQLLEMPSPDSIEVVQPGADASAMLYGNPQSIYDEAVSVRAAVRAADLRVQSAERSIASARSGYMPTLSFVAGLSTSYYNVSRMTNDPFGRQLNNNLSKYVGLSLAIPIFDRFTTRNAIRQAKLSHADYELQAEGVRKTLYKDIQQAYYNAVAARAKYESCMSAEESAEQTYKLALKKYEYGRAYTTEYTEAKTAWQRAQVERVQAKYDYLFRCKILDFYRGRPLQ